MGDQASVCAVSVECVCDMSGAVFFSLDYND